MDGCTKLLSGVRMMMIMMTTTPKSNFKKNEGGKAKV
jgi:hypothetical protein